MTTTGASVTLTATDTDATEDGTIDNVSVTASGTVMATANDGFSGGNLESTGAGVTEKTGDKFYVTDCNVTKRL